MRIAARIHPDRLWISTSCSRRFRANSNRRWSYLARCKRGAPLPRIPFLPSIPSSHLLKALLNRKLHFHPSNPPLRNNLNLSTPPPLPYPNHSPTREEWKSKVKAVETNLGMTMAMFESGLESLIVWQRQRRAGNGEWRHCKRVSWE